MVQIPLAIEKSLRFSWNDALLALQRSLPWRQTDSSQ
ncbi:predicted protein [Botrytis cinerea T4]|uniref:Uncharacterized protein n=1 Tax=Botryotinia fuckeliana (strain T4) TaxID=999810 RepID=G2YEF8_BOTF4|nr:predicted protein [Botrytis cinerea T4]